MKVLEIMSEHVATCRPDDSDERAAHLMWEADCGALAVVDEEGRALGVVTDRDVCMCAYTTGRPLADLRVRDCMAWSPFVCKPDDSIERALSTMAEARVRRLPVLDRERHVVGLLSLNDVVRAVGDLPEGGVRRALEHAALDAFAHIGAPRQAELAPAATPRTGTPTRQPAATR